MKQQFFFLFAIIITLVGCVSQSDHEKVKAENEKLKIEIKQLNIDINLVKSENENLVAEKRKQDEKKRIASLYSEADALKLVKDYYDFYDADNVYRNPRIRRVSDNVFRVSLEECTKKGSFSDDNFFWRATVMKLTVYENGKYDIIREIH